MKYYFSCFIFLFLINTSFLYAQSDINKAWRVANPVKPGAVISDKEKLKIHEDHLKQAVANDDITQQFYGNLYLFTDHMDEQYYTAALPFLLTAEKIANKAANINWQGFLKLRNGWFAAIVQNDLKKAVEEFKTGAALSEQAKDSFCRALCLEQVSTMYIGLKNFDSSQHYFNMAMPVLRTSANISLNGAFNNLACLLISEGRFENALLYNDSAIQIVHAKKDKREEISLLTNRAIILSGLKQYDSAEAIFKYCIAADAANKWTGNLMNDYEGLKNTYHAMGNNDSAFHYNDKYLLLKDSLYGVEVNLKVANIQAADKRELDKLVAQNTLQKRNWIIITGVLVLCFIVWLWVSQIRKAKRKQLHTRANLEQLTRTLIEKNGQLADTEQRILTLQEKSLEDDASLKQYLHDKKEFLAQIIETKQDLNTGVPSSKQDDFEKNIYNQRILTAADWSSFKIYFEKAFPGYLLRLRTAYTSLTEAEERMFLFIKLKLTNKEVAAILGISADSVNKTRSRLRRRLVLDEKVDVDEFVRLF